MSTLQTGAERLFRVRRTVHEMLRDRGYLVDTADINMSEEEFSQKYGDAPGREQLTVMVQKRDDPTDQILVFWPSDPKVGVKPIKKCVERMKEEEVKRAVLVIQQSMTAFAKQSIQEMCSAESLVLEQFLEAELLVNITEHVLVPQHMILTKEEKAILLKRYKLKEAQLPRMQLVDPISRYYGLTRGQVVKIIRPSETAGKYVTYRLVV